MIINIQKVTIPLHNSHTPHPYAGSADVWAHVGSSTVPRGKIVRGNILVISQLYDKYTTATKIYAFMMASGHIRVRSGNLLVISGNQVVISPPVIKLAYAVIKLAYPLRWHMR